MIQARGTVNDFKPVPAIVGRTDAGNREPVTLSSGEGL
jgi:hypothetical protein